MPSLHRHGTDQKGVGIFQQVFCNAKRADVYTSALLADAMKPLNVLSKFENHFAIRTVRFQVQLEADGYFFLKNFRVCNRRKQGELVPTCNFRIRFYKSSFKTLVGLRPNPISCIGVSFRKENAQEKLERMKLLIG